MSHRPVAPAVTLMALAVVASLTAVGGRGARAGGAPSSMTGHAGRAAAAISALDFDEARKEIALSDPSDAATALESANLAVYEARCDEALLLLGRPDLLASEAGAALFDVAKGCARVTAATVADVDDAHDVVVRYQDEQDRALTPLIVETVALARAALTRDLGVSWPKPTRVLVVRDLMSLSAVTGLPQKSAQTTGTVAVAKWGRITLLSPRASEHGYPWRDTIAHELTHLAVTHASADHAPLWLQEGVAKREEVRWRAPGPFDDRPSPDSVVARGFELKLGFPLDELGPSIAMLPSADAAMVAFAEVTSFVRYLAATGGPDTLPTLMTKLRTAPDVDTALRDATGADLHTWDGRWREGLTAHPPPRLPATFGLGGDVRGMREVRDRLRLAELLYGRRHPKEALREMNAIKGEAAESDPSVRSVRARVLEAAGQRDAALREVADPSLVSSSYGPWWAIRGRWQREDGLGSDADASFVEAVATDPFDVQAACEVDDSVTERMDDPGPDTSARALCDAAKARHQPSLGRD
jgi:hypothetical protein